MTMHSAYMGDRSIVPGTRTIQHHRLVRLLSNLPPFVVSDVLCCSRHL
jgi:hypothetical protein